jgi:dTDP-4-dehydrorhamnose reductase
VRWLVVGASGMLGQDLMALLAARGDNAVGVDREVMDITDPVSCADTVVDVDVVVNCAAYTAVDAAESDEATAFNVNAVGAANLARAARAQHARIVHISTDYVFGGTATIPYAEDAAIAPRSAYGRTKGAGEWAVRSECPDHIVVRTAWLYGARGACFPKTIARVARERGSVDVIDDQFGQPTWTVDLADLVHRLVHSGAPTGTYHGTASGETSWYGFAQAVVDAADMDSSIVARTSSHDFIRPAPRPSYSVLAHGALAATGVQPIGPWVERWREAAPSVLA